MNSKVLKTLEFDKIKELLKQYAASALGHAKVSSLMPSVEYEEITALHEETDEAMTILRLKGHAPLGGIFDIRPHVKRAQIGGMLSPSEFVQVASTIRASRKLTLFVEELLEEEVDIPLLQEKMGTVIPLPYLEQDIRKVVDDNGEILDTASEALRTIRTQLRANEGRIREKLERMIRSSNAQKMLSDAIITIRNDRYVIPVKQEYRGQYGGIIHDQSSSGQTLFIEPEAIVQLNNQLRELRLKEQSEIEKILRGLSESVQESGEELLLIVSVLSDIDFMFTKAKFGRSIKGSKPTINNERRVRLNKARHPLLPIDEAVANDIELGTDFSSIVITGPNTGGKTVTLKTLGLTSLMAQAGLPIPALDGSEVGVFRTIYADIGDEQSIEQSLSTFSSHMVNIVDILKKVDHESLVLFDELGAGTDPQEGAALAISILDEVHGTGARVVATTHYPELKAYGYNREGVVNASVEFNVETLSPTYKLLLGVPGRSNAFEISKRLGLSDSVIQRAKSHIGTDSKEVENMIASLEDSRRQGERELEEAHELLRQAEKMHKDMQKQMMEYYEKKDTLYEKAQQKATEVVEKAKAEAEQVIKDLRKMQHEKSAQIKEHELIQAKKQLEDATPKLKTSGQKKKVNQAKHELKPGDEVKVLSFDQKGHLVERVSAKEWQVQMGIMKMKVKESDLEFIQSQQKVEPKPLATVKGKDFHVSLELDLRGERFENALSRVEKYIDDALLAGYPRVSIIHGKGTGALRQGVQEYLKNHRSVKNIRFGDAGEGGTGVTVVQFK
ncbi:endonuclease MutS2 [Rossellomorea aquimaris]|uniref:Endonuclease MutS2 n=1 Tax=Rossellomorea aquimaris TaxID=189382 RepID=A0A5D4TTZ4_9BACI|nr:endonuclease MutS2 [Rossellomorea aquimaris]TYS77862.1 endonuclease MutS2 [Rossellomorea aquimaris]TYS87045.1 endonuclease MutS2 [Rossellomorea aquimaris]